MRAGGPKQTEGSSGRREKAGGSRYHSQRGDDWMTTVITWGWREEVDADDLNQAL